MNLRSSLLLLLFSYCSFCCKTAAAVKTDPALYFETDNDETYLSWLNDDSSTNYETSVFLESNNGDGGVGVFWTIQDEIIQLAVVAQATGWAAFGLAEAGGMKGADMVVFETSNNELYDGHVLDTLAAPLRDECQNWELVNSISDGGFIIFEAQRLLDTGDTFDRPIMNDSDLIVPPTRVIAAWGNSEKATYHGTNRARSSIRFFRPNNADDEAAFQEAMAAQAEGSFELRANDYPIKSDLQTEYAYFCFTKQDLLVDENVPMMDDLHTIGVEPLVDDDAKAYVHHFILYATADPYDTFNTGINSTMEQCRDDLQAFENAYTWAPGEGSFALPDNVGGPLGGNNGGFQSFKLEIHYDNPNGDAGVLDSSGIRMYYTSQKREHDLGILPIGDPFLALFNQTVGPGLVSHTFDCPGECSAVTVSERVTVLREYMHMHATGKRMYNDHIRDGQVIRTGAVDYWDFDQNGDLALQQDSFEILPGDAFRTRCYYESSDDEVWGLGSENEMCIAFLYYYPRYNGQGLYICGPEISQTGVASEACDAGYARMDLETTDELERIFGGPGSECKALPSTQSTGGKSSAPVTPYTRAAMSAVVLAVLMAGVVAL